MGNVEYVTQETCLKWNIKQFNGQKEYLMRARDEHTQQEDDSHEQGNYKLIIKHQLGYSLKYHILLLVEYRFDI